MNFYKEVGIDYITVEECQFTNPDYHKKSKCFEIYRNITILSNGDVVPCCVDYDGKMILGSVKKRFNLKSIFNNKFYRNLRKSFKNNRTIPVICQKCHYRTIRH